MRNYLNAIIIGVCILVGCTLLAIQLHLASKRLQPAPNTIQVEGIARWKVDANLVIWPITYRIGDADLISLNETIDQQAEMITAFLLLNGITKEEIHTSTPHISDRATLPLASIGNHLYQYIAANTITVYSNNVTAVETVRAKMRQLSAQGIVFDLTESPEYVVSELNQLRPKIVKQARDNALKLAKTMAGNENATLGSVRNINQDRLTINAVDSHSQQTNVVTATVQIEYDLIVD